MTKRKTAARRAHSCSKGNESKGFTLIASTGRLEKALPKPDVIAMLCSFQRGVTTPRTTLQ